MAIQDFIALLGRHPWQVAGVCLAQPLLALLLGWLCGGRGSRRPWKYGYSFLVYLTCVPGILAAVLTAYSVFFLGANLLRVNLLVYVLPLVTMVVTLALIGREVRFSAIPGFDRLGGLMLLLGISFAVALFVVKLRIWILFGSSLTTLFVLALLAFLLLRWGSHKLFR